MAFVNPDKGRAIIEEDRGEIIITIPSKKNWFIILFMLFWLGGWLMGEVMVIGTFILEKIPASAKLFSIFWLGGWTVGGGFAIFAVLWLMFGREVIKINKEILVIEKRVLYFKITKEYGMEYMKNLRIGNTSNFWLSNSKNQEMLGLNVGNIYFDYGMKTIKFGVGIEEAESKYIIEKIKEVI